MSYTVEELKVMLKKALATAKANRLNLEEVLENNLALREENATLRAEIAGLEARVGDQENNSRTMNQMFDRVNTMEGRQAEEYNYNRRNRPNGWTG